MAVRCCGSSSMDTPFVQTFPEARHFGPQDGTEQSSPVHPTSQWHAMRGHSVSSSPTTLSTSFQAHVPWWLQLLGQLLVPQLSPRNRGSQLHVPFTQFPLP